MTEDRDFKKVVRGRSAKTGESYQAAKRQLEGQPRRLSVRVDAMWEHRDGLVLGCVVVEGRLSQGMAVTVMAGEDILHRGTVASLRYGKEDRAVVTSGPCGIMLDPPYLGYIVVEPEGSGLEVLGALRPVVAAPMPDRVVG
jgi:translation initiation factor IF-2